MTDTDLQVRLRAHVDGEVLQSMWARLLQRQAFGGQCEGSERGHRHRQHELRLGAERPRMPGGCQLELARLSAACCDRPLVVTMGGFVRVTGCCGCGQAPGVPFGMRYGPGSSVEVALRPAGGVAPV